MDWPFVLIVLAAYAFVGLVTGLASRHIEGAAGLVGSGCGLVFGAVPVSLVTVGVLWITGNNRLWTGIVVSVLGLYAVGKTMREMPRPYP